MRKLDSRNPLLTFTLTLACVGVVFGRHGPAGKAVESEPAAASRPAPAATTDDLWAAAARNADRAQEVFTRCNRLMYAWYKYKGKDNYLLPQNLKCREWNEHNSGADLWPFFVITAHYTDPPALNTFVRQTLLDEIRLTTRLGRIGDAYDIDKNTFIRREVSLQALIFGAAEYVKDGLLSVAEVMGRTAWFDRGADLLDDIFAHAPVETRFGRIPCNSAEVNGDMLQSLCRYYAATGQPRYKQWAERIGDAWFLDAMPKCNDLPCHFWDFAAGRPIDDRLSLSDHGNEIIFGLSELVMLEHVHDPAKAKQYTPAMQRMVDKLLSAAVNEDGLWYRAIQPSTLKVLNTRTPDTWGYALDGVYVLYQVTGQEKYRQAVHRALRGINSKDKYLNWGGMDDFADSIESGIVLFNRIREEQTLEWLEKVVGVFLAKQKEDGIVEGWHGDGNYARTALMYAMMKTAGTRVTPWRGDVKFGAAARDDVLCVLLSSDKPWQGTLHLDYPRHRMHMGLAVNYPRLNEFPEWYTVEPARLYGVSVNGKDLPAMLGDDLIRGLPIQVDKAAVRVTVRPLAGPPYGVRQLRIEGPSVQGGDGPFRLGLAVRNQTGQAQEISLTTSFGRIEPAQARVDDGGCVDAVLTGTMSRNALATVEAAVKGGRGASHVVRLVHDKNLVGLVSFDAQQYQGRGYLWCGKEPVEFTLPARKGQAHTLRLLWGAKKDQRAAVVTVNGHARSVSGGGYDGFEWLEVKIDPRDVTGDVVKVRIEAEPPGREAAFISEARLTAP